MEKEVKQMMAEMLAEWLLKALGLLIDKPSENDIVETLEEHEE